MEYYRICKICNNRFKTTRETQYLCSAECGHKNFIKRFATAREKITKICKRCGEPFKVNSYEAHRYIYCSKSCRKHRIKKICPRCNKVFDVPFSHADRYTFCSYKCKIAKTIYRKCPRCGKIFNSANDRRKYCSEKCRRPSINITCKNCRMKFRVRPGEKGKRRFCSVSCYRKFVGETSFEKFIKDILKSLNIKFIQECKIGRYSIDFYIPGKRIAIEADGKYWHRDFSRDKRKNKFLNKNGISVLRIPESFDKKTKASKDFILSYIKNPIIQTDIFCFYPSSTDDPN